MSALCRMHVLVEADRDGRLGAKEAGSVARHLQTCVDCQRFVGDLERLAELGRRTGTIDEPNPLEQRRERLRLLRAAAAPRPVRRRRSMRLPALAAIVVGLTVLLIGQVQSPEPVADAEGALSTVLRSLADVGTGSSIEATVRAAPQARFERRQLAQRERVRLFDGAVDVEVPPLPPGHRFLVATGDAEVEVQGTAFSVRAEDDQLVEVVVRDGEVEVRLGDSVTQLLPGQSWRRDEPLALETEAQAIRPGTAAPTPGRPGVVVPTGAPTIAPQPGAQPGALAPAGDEAQAPAEPSEPQPVAAGVASPPTAGRATAEFARALELLEQGSYRAAAKALGEFGRRHGTDPQAEDADFLAIVALQRAKRHAAAAQAARRYLARYPKGARRAEAAAIAGRLDPPK